jgi:GT2 family glycosyltransferase
MAGITVSPPAPALRPIRADERIGITICTKDRPGYLASLLASLVNQTYSRWTLVLNDQSASPVAEDATVKDLLMLIETRRHGVTVLRSTEPRTRYQQAMEALPKDVEVVLRVDDDVLLTPSFVEKILRPYHFFPGRPLAGVGPCLPEPHIEALPLESSLADPSWVPRIDRPIWRLQGHAYTGAEILEVESLWGSAICYRRSAVDAVGGWAVPGYSHQIFREDSDLSARLIAAGYDLMVSTEALGWHLVAPSGGSREYAKSPRGNVMISDRAPFEADDRLFSERVRALVEAGAGGRELRRYRIQDLERGAARGRPWASWRGRAIRRAGRIAYGLLRYVRDLRRFVMDRG